MTAVGSPDRVRADDPPCHDVLPDNGATNRHTAPPGRKAEPDAGEEE